LQQERNLTTGTFNNFMQGQNPQGPSHGGGAQFASGNGNSSYGSGQTVLYEASDRKLDFTLVTEEGGEYLMNFLLAQAARRTPSSGNQHSSEVELPDPAHIREWGYHDILRFPGKLKEEWRQACLEEISALKKRSVFELVKLPKGKKAIRNRWVFDIKSDGRKRARLVAKGFSQIEGIDYNELFSPVVRYESVRLLLALAALEQWHMQAVDVKTAFLYGKLDEEIYMQQPQGFLVKGKEKLVWRLTRALYGLKQAALAWWKELDASMKQMGFTRLRSDAGIFVNKKYGIIVIVYVDDCIFLGKDLKRVLQAKEAFMIKWECRDIGEAKEFLRMRIRREGRKLILDQHVYLDKIVTRFNLQKSNSVYTPLPYGYEPEENKETATATQRLEYQSVIGSLLYIMLGTRPDVSFAVIKMAQFSANPSLKHLNVAKHIIQYLNTTRERCLVYDGASNKGLIAFTDSDWASDKIKRRSQTGFFFMIAGAIFSWQSRAQKTVALSSTEAEYMALSDCSRQAVWIKSLLLELGINVEPIHINGDNQGSIFIGSNPVQEKRSKHIDIRYHYIRQCIEDKKVSLYFVEGAVNPADMFTKNLGRVKFQQFRDQLGLESR
jgi:hypothetical protein